MKLGTKLRVKGINRAGEGLIRAGCGSKKLGFLKKIILLHPLTNFKI